MKRTLGIRSALIAALLFAAVPQAQAGCPSFFKTVYDRIFTHRCCVEVKTSETPPEFKPLSARDPYHAGLGLALGGGRPRLPVGFELSKPSKIQGPQLAFEPLDREIRDESHLLDILGTSRPLSETSTLAGSGTFSKAYFLDAEAPKEGAADWLRRNARFVLKQRKISDHYDRYLKRDLALRGIFSELVQTATLDGKPFLRLAADYSSPETIKHGLLIQEAVHGTTAMDLQLALSRCQMVDGQLRIPARSRQTFTSAGMDPKSWDDLEKLQNSLSALEEFYRRTHVDVQRFSKKNSLPLVGNKSRVGVETVGFDFGHGNNVIWSAKEQLWIAIDW